MDLQLAAAPPVPADTTFEERSPRHGWRSFWMNVLLTELVLLLFPSAFILGGTRVHFWMFVSALVVLPVAMLCAWGQNAYLRRRAGAVAYSDGKVSTVVDSNIHCVSLDDCRWYYGRDTRATVHRPNEMPLVGVPAILIEFPHHCHTEGRDTNRKIVPTGPVIVAVGYDAETHRAWREVLERSEAQHDAERERMSSPFSSSAVFVLALAVLPLCLAGAFWVSAGIAWMLMKLDIGESIARSISAPFFIPGAAYVALYVLLLYLYYQRRFCVTPEQRKATMELVRPYKFWFLGIFAYTVISPLVHVAEEPVSNTLQVLTTVLLTALVTWHFSILLEEPAGATTE